MAQSWYDITKDGRRLERVIKQMLTRMETIDWEDENAVATYLSYMDRFLKATATKVNVAETVLGIKQILAEAKKTLPTPSIEPAKVLVSGK